MERRSWGSDRIGELSGFGAIAMSRMNSPGMGGRPTPNVYTGLAFVSMLASLIALVYMVIKFMDMGVFR
jgi:hypothetical protein